MNETIKHDIRHRLLALLLAMLTVIATVAVYPNAESSAFTEVSSDGNWYTWGAMQSTIDCADLHYGYGSPVSMGYVNGLYAVNVSTVNNRAYKVNMNYISEYALKADGYIPDGTQAPGYYGANFWSGQVKNIYHNGFVCPESLNKSANTVNEIPRWRGERSFLGQFYYDQWKLLSDSAAIENSANIASSVSKFSTRPGGASIGFIINTTNTRAGFCTGVDGAGKFSVGFVPADNFVEIVSETNESWAQNAYCGLTNASKGLYVVFASTDPLNYGYDLCKVVNDGKSVCVSDLDGWVGGYTFRADGSEEYRLRLVRTGGEEKINGMGLYSMFIDTPSGSIEIASDVELYNDMDYNYYISYSTPAYSNTSPVNSGYVVTEVSSCGKTQSAESFTGGDHAWDDGEVMPALECVPERSVKFTCTDADCRCVRYETTYVESAPHKYGAWQITTEPTCHLKGIKSRSCKVCGNTVRANVPATGHVYSEWDVLEAPTCTAPGKRERVCASCNEIVSEFISANGHTFGEWKVTKAATVDAPGEQARVCSICGYTEKKAAAYDSFPRTVAENYALTVYDADGLTAIRIAPGVYTTAKDIKAAPGLVTLSASDIAKKTIDGVFSYELASMGEYSVWLRYSDGNEYIKRVSVNVMYPTITTDGVIATIHGIGGISDFTIAKGHHTTYRSTANNKIVMLTSVKIGDVHDFTYASPLPGVGEYTAWIRFKDSTRQAECIHFQCLVSEPEFIANGILITAKNLTGARVIRLAPGEWNTPAEIKRAAGCRNFTAKQFGSADSYTIQNSKDAIGVYSISVEYNNGHSVVYHFTPEHKVPVGENLGAIYRLSGLVGASYVRYAPGVYATSGELKAANGVVTVREDNIIGYELDISGVGEYTYIVQYDDNSSYMSTFEVGEFAKSDITVSKAFSDDMIVQRDKPLSVWGFASKSDVGRAVKVTFRGANAYGLIDATGAWKATFDRTFTESTAFDAIEVFGGANTVTLNRVMTGDVYFIIGQSNVFGSIRTNIQDRLDVAEEPEEVPELCDFDDTRNIRFYRNSSIYYTSYSGLFAPGTDTLFRDVFADLRWYMPSDEETLSFSAIGYLIAYNFSNAITVPIGIIEIDASGAPLASFAPNELNDRWDSDVLDVKTGRHYMKVGGSTPYAYTTSLPSRFAYNQQLYPLMNFSCAGLLWYQGESDYDNTIFNYGKGIYTFTTEFVELMDYFRSHMGNSDFPIYIMEFPACYYNEGNNQFIDLGNIRSELGMLHSKVENSYLIPSSDLWDKSKVEYENNIHPYCKPEQAYRAFTIMLNTKYGLGRDVRYATGPNMRSVEYPSPNTAVITFDYVGDGLRIRDFNGNGRLYGFEVLTRPDSYSVGWVQTPNARITAPDQITITTPYPIYGVRYNAHTEWCYPDDANLGNSVNMPMIAFADYKN